MRSSRRRDGRFRELELATIDEGLQNAPCLHVQVIVIDRREGIAENREIFDRFVHAVVVDVVARRLGAQHDVIANVLLDEAIAIVAANHRAGQVQRLRSRFATCP